MRKIAILITLTMLLASLAGCAGDDGDDTMPPPPSEFIASYEDSQTVHEGCYVEFGNRSSGLPVKFGIGSNDGPMDDPEYQIEAQIPGLTGENPFIFNAENVLEFDDLVTRLTDNVVELVMLSYDDCNSGAFDEDFDGDDWTDEWRNSVYSPLNGKTVTEIRLHVTDKEAYSDTKDTYSFRWEFYGFLDEEEDDDSSPVGEWYSAEAMLIDMNEDGTL
ncbi:uncharacterized protein METZ01_LOCUS455627, partial [marine metagenome]